MKTKEELNALKEEVKALNKKLRELTDEELAQVTGGEYLPTRLCPNCYKVMYYDGEKYVCPDPFCGHTEY